MKVMHLTTLRQEIKSTSTWKAIHILKLDIVACPSAHEWCSRGWKPFRCFWMQFPFWAWPNLKNSFLNSCSTLVTKFSPQNHLSIATGRKRISGPSRIPLFSDHFHYQPPFFNFDHRNSFLGVQECRNSRLIFGKAQRGNCVQKHRKWFPAMRTP